jgi:hypothetical protein
MEVVMLNKFSLILLLFLIILQPLTYAQFSEEGENVPLKRTIWYYGQRQFPFVSLPINAYTEAIQD